MEEIDLLIKKDEIMESIEERVMIFFRKNISKNIKEDYIINHPNFLGDEATFLLVDFYKEFGINKGYLEVDKYFNPVPFPFEFLIDLLTFNFSKEKQKHPIITVKHMIEVAKRKEWFEPE